MKKRPSNRLLGFLFSAAGEKGVKAGKATSI
jgi:hypothetical protein